MPAIAALMAKAESLVTTTLRPIAAVALSLCRTENHHRPVRARRRAVTEAAIAPSTIAQNRKKPASLSAKPGGRTRFPSMRPGNPSAKTTLATAALNTRVNTARFWPRSLSAGMPMATPAAKGTAAANGSIAR